MTLWQRKLAAWLHDPAEKALVLMRDFNNAGQRIGHENGSVAGLRAALGIRKSDFDTRADHYAAAADRPQWPIEDGRPRPAWANVRFVEQPVLVHPLSGEAVELSKLDDIAAAHIRNASLDHFTALIERGADGQPDFKLTQLAFWRFGPEPDLVAPEIGALWRLLPADTRVPDHSIWQHLDVVSAISGAMAEGDAPALLTMSFGPVQGFIAQARSISDLWAGSHLLSSLVWAGLAVVCDQLGPDAVLFPNLRGVAAVDRWLLQLAPQWRQRFAKIDAAWLNKASDANPLFAATLPNKFMAIVPAGRVQALAEQVTATVRAQALAWAMEAAEKAFEAARRDCSDTAHWRAQVRDQMQGFPEVHWGSADWPVAPQGEQADPAPLRAALQAFGSQGLFEAPVWQVLNRDITLDGIRFYQPNAGMLYPAVFDLAERALAAAKALRPFEPLAQQGFRCTLTGEFEWLTDNPTLLTAPPTARAAASVWGQVAGQFGIKQGEHLGAIGTLKRLWPTLFAQQAAAELGLDSIQRFVVSTHTMALASPIARLVENFDTQVAAALAALTDELEADDPVVLPASLARSLHRLDDRSARLLRRLPAALDRERSDQPDTQQRNEALQRRIADLFGSQRPETYYALIQMDGDRLGAWMAGNETAFQRSFASTWHPQVRNAVTQKFGHLPALKSYLDSPRPPSPARHAAISAVLNDFSTQVARHVVENVFKGKLIYAGGDDVLAMVSVDDLLPCMLLLRAAYSGVGDWSDALPGLADLAGLRLRRGYVELNRRLLPMMGTQATASMGAVVAHHQAPLAGVLRALHAAEQRAKQHLNGARNAFCLRLMKRGGGEVAITSRFWPTPEAPPPLQDSALGLLLRFAQAMGESEMSRRAVYNTTEWLAGLPSRRHAGEPLGMNDADWCDMVTRNLARQFDRQKGVQAHAAEFVQLGVQAHAAKFVQLACAESQPADTAKTLENLLVCAEFFAREGRAFSRSTQPKD